MAFQEVDTAYEIQEANTSYWLSLGRRIVGCRIGLTSPAVQKQLDVDRPDFGILFADMQVAEGKKIALVRVLQPKIEAEVAFELGSDVDVANPTVTDIIRATAFVMPALEIVGSRIKNLGHLDLPPKFHPSSYSPVGVEKLSDGVVMKLVRFGERGAEKPGIVDADGKIRDMSGVVRDLVPEHLAPVALAKLSRIATSSLPEVLASVRSGVPLVGVGKFVAIGLNCADHAAEANLPLPSEPIVFQKAATSLSGPNDPVLLPKASKKSDWEVELGIVIGARASYVERADALAGYTTHMFDMRCRENGIEDWLTKIKHPWTNGQAERMNRTIKEAKRAQAFRILSRASTNKLVPSWDNENARLYFETLD